MIDIAIWMLAGAALGWAGFSYMQYNEERGLMVSAIIGAIGGVIGGKLIAPMFTDAPVAGAFSISALVFAAIVAAGVLFAGNLIHNKWGV